MKAKIKLFATLRNGRFDIAEMEFSDGTTILNLIEQLKIAQEDAAILFINGVHADLDSVIKEGDEVAVFPPIGGG